MSHEWKGPGDPIYPRPRHQWNRRQMVDVMDDPQDILNEIAASWPTPDPTNDLDWCI